MISVDFLYSAMPIVLPAFCGMIGVWTGRALHAAKAERARAERMLTAARDLHMMSARRPAVGHQGTLGVVIAMVDAAGGKIVITPNDFANAINRRVEWQNAPDGQSLIVATASNN